MAIGGLTNEQIAALIGIGVFIPGQIIFASITFDAYQRLEDLNNKKKEDSDSAQQKADEEDKQKLLQRLRNAKRMETIWPFLAMVDAYFQWSNVSMYLLIPPLILAIPGIVQKRKTDEQLMKFDLDKVGIIVSLKMMSYFVYAFYLIAKIYQTAKPQ